MVAYTVVYISGFELAVRELRFADGMSFCGSLQAVFVKFTNQNFPVGIFVFLKVFVYTSSSTNRLYLPPKSVKLYTIFWQLNGILAPNPQWGLTALPIPSNYWKLLPKSLPITSEKIIRTLHAARSTLPNPVTIRRYLKLSEHPLVSQYLKVIYSRHLTLPKYADSNL